jgi:hypothetical protein
MLMRRHRNGFNRLLGSLAIIGSVAMVSGLANFGTANAAPPFPQVQWVNHFDLISGDPTVTTVTPQLNTTLGGGLSGLQITSSTTGDVDHTGSNKVVYMALELPKQVKITGVRVCYELSDPGANGSFIDQTRLAQIDRTDAHNALVQLDDPTHLDATGPICANSQLVSPPIKASGGSTLLSFRVFFASTSDQIVIRTVGLLVK